MRIYYYFLEEWTYSLTDKNASQAKIKGRYKLTAFLTESAGIFYTYPTDIANTFNVIFNGSIRSK